MVWKNPDGTICKQTDITQIDIWEKISIKKEKTKNNRTARK